MSPFVYVLSINGLLFVLSIVFYFFPPKKINALYGYRTNKSKLNEDIWQFANKFFIKQLLKYAAISLVAAVLFVSVLPKISWQPMTLMVLSLAVSVIKTEQAITQNFDDEGKRK